MADISAWLLANGVGLLNLGVVGIGGYFLLQRIVALKTAVDAQKASLDAQDKVIAGFRSLLEASDIPQMVKRFEDYKKLVDRESEALLAEAQRQAETLLRTLDDKAKGALREMVKEIAALSVLASQWMPDVSIERRYRYIEMVKDKLSPWTLEQLLREASNAPPPPLNLQDLFDAMPSVSGNPVLPPESLGGILGPEPEMWAVQAALEADRPVPPTEKQT